jgi:SAM-dependent methyltransferase
MAARKQPCLSVVVPCFNEEATLGVTVDRVLASPYTAEVLIVDDGSTDRSLEEAAALAARDARVRVLRQPHNLGKGAALRRGFRAATADYVIVQDADLEYDPADWSALLEPLIDGRADVVYGSRFGNGGGPRRVLYFWHAVGNRFLTLVSNAFTNLNLTDMETGYKVFRREVIQSLDLKEDRFGFEPEITEKLARARVRIYEVAISYAGRTYSQGKKIGWRDGLRAFWCILRYSRVGDAIIPRRERQPAGEEAADEELAEVLAALESADGYSDWVHGLLADHLGERILEVGAGHGTMTVRLAAHGHVTAVEPSERAAKLLSERVDSDERIDVVCGLIRDCDAGADFDTAVVVNVLEHVTDDVGLLSELAQRLLPGGTIVLFVPAHEWLYSDFDRRIGHRRRYRLTTLAEVMSEAGLDIEVLEYVNGPGALAWFGGVRVAGMTPTPALVRTYERLVLPAVARFEREHAIPFGQSVVAVGRVPNPSPRIPRI